MSKLTIDECKSIIMQGRKQLTAAQERIAELEQFIRDYHDATGDLLTEHDYLLACGFEQRMRGLLGGDAE